jgi:TPR repeat protein
MKQDQAKALALFQKACKSGSHEGCTHLAFMRYSTKEKNSP